MGGWAVFVLDRKVVSEWVLNGGSYGEETRVNERVVGTSLWASPRIYEGAGYVEALGREVLGLEHPGRRKG